jgi:origin recognition complex subunit 4
MKRKSVADASANDSSAQKRRTRSSGPLVDTQPLFPPSKTRTPSKRPIAVESVHSTRSTTDPRDTSSLKENEVEHSDDADELNLSPSKLRRVASARRVVMDSVEVVTPSKRRIANSVSLDVISSGSPSLKNNFTNYAPASLAQRHTSIKRTAVSPRTPSKSGAVNLEISKPSTPALPSGLPRVLSPHLRPCLNAQKRAILAALQNPPDFMVDDDDERSPLTNTVASQQLSNLLTGTVTRGEGNSCLVLGPRGSGKTRVRAYMLLVI